MLSANSQMSWELFIVRSFLLMWSQYYKTFLQSPTPTTSTRKSTATMTPSPTSTPPPATTTTTSPATTTTKKNHPPTHDKTTKHLQSKENGEKTDKKLDHWTRRKIYLANIKTSRLTENFWDVWVVHVRTGLQNFSPLVFCPVRPMAEQNCNFSDKLLRFVNN